MRGFTVIEMLIAMMIAAVVLAIAIPRGQSGIDRLTVQSAAGDARSTLHRARALALAGHAAIAVDIDSATGMFRIRRGSEILLSRAIGLAHGVRVTPTRDSLTYDPHGLGRGAANLSIVLRKRSAAETVFVSRMGRIR